jgi:hypothetical protein
LKSNIEQEILKSLDAYQVNHIIYV